MAGAFHQRPFTTRAAASERFWLGKGHSAERVSCVSAKQHSVWKSAGKLTKDNTRQRKFSMRARLTKFSKSGSVENSRRSNSQNLSRLCVSRCVSLVVWLFLGGGFFFLRAVMLPAGFTESQWGSAMSSAATAMAFAPDGRLFVCLQSGQVRVINKDGVLLANPFVRLSVDSNGERGLLGVALIRISQATVTFTSITPCLVHRRIIASAGLERTGMSLRPTASSSWSISQLEQRHQS